MPIQSVFFKSCFGIALITSLVACVKDPGLEPGDSQEPIQLEIPESFNHSTTANVSLALILKDNQNNALSSVRVSVASTDAPDKILFTGATDVNGSLTTDMTLPSYIEKLVVYTNYVGLPNQIVLPVQGTVNAVLGGSDPITYETMEASSARTAYTSGARTQAITYSYLGTWNGQGVPNYKEAKTDTVSSELMSWINASLPEQKPVPTYHPDYVDATTKTNMDVLATSDVWVTFVHEGAGWTNSLGFYTYPTGSAPASVNDITNIKIIYPNVSYAGSGGGLKTGMKVKIGRFEPGTSIGFVLVAQGWNGSGVGNGAYKLFSNSNLNPESNTNLQKHNVLLYDSKYKITILGFEDWRRDDVSGCDNDFNDAVFYISSNPVDGLNVKDFLPVDKPIDSDKDGINDTYDDFPKDPTKAFINYYPAKGVPGTLAFEDMWPTVGDYDMNDLVVKYYHTTIANAQNKVIQLKTDIVPTAVGATFKNGFGFEMPIAQSKIKSVSGSRLTENIVTLASNGVEANQNKSVVIAFDNAFSLYSSGSGQYENVVSNTSVNTPDTVKLTVDFATPVTSTELGDMTFNPFLIANATRGREIHLAGYSNTKLANPTYFGTHQDNTNTASGKYYKTSGNLPWAISFVQPFDYPSEGKALTSAYVNYAAWAKSGGTLYKDWYLNKSGYRNTGNIYTKK
ncbi:LruC domain-containing protein [Cytophagaceae bacterium DM2B3-1]|uniref:LruC domain-containing protein n=1 Tax=Xanthocytophaga flava TaxID=3048013 RepID=A0ABT7CJH2_9BACT|nr:LruC domain-containing protein [Xanthocytophaga flavus]MDJ1493905.1 LruC domain-containing protein [Xanthocytophaga flavus]